MGRTEVVSNRNQIPGGRRSCRVITSNDGLVHYIHRNGTEYILHPQNNQSRLIPRVSASQERSVQPKRHEFTPSLGIRTAIHKAPVNGGQLAIMAGEVDPRTESYVSSLLTAADRLLQKAETSDGTLARALRERAVSLQDQARRHVPTAVGIAKGSQTNIQAVSGEVQGSTAVGMNVLGSSGVVQEGKNIQRVDGQAAYSSMQNEHARLEMLERMAADLKVADRSYDQATITPPKSFGGRLVGAIVSKLTGVPNGTVHIERPMEKGPRGEYIHRAAEMVRATQNKALPPMGFADPDVSDHVTHAEIDRAQLIVAREDAVNDQWVQGHTEHYETERGSVTIDTSPQALSIMAEHERLYEENYGPRPDIEHTETRGPLSWLFG